MRLQRAQTWEMNISEFFGFGGYERPAEGYLSWQHLVFVSALTLCMVLASVLLGKRNRNRSRKEKNRVLIISALLMDALELFKITILCIRHEDPFYWVNVLPLFLCSIQLITLPLAAFSKGRLKEASLDFVMIFGLLGAILGTYFAGNNYAAYPVLSFDNVISGLTHTVAGFASLYIMISGMTSMKQRNIPITAGILGGFCAAAYIANLFVDCNYMFLSRGDGTPYDLVFRFVNGHPVFYPLLVVLLFVLYISAYYYVYYEINKRIRGSRCGKEATDPAEEHAKRRNKGVQNEKICYFGNCGRNGRLGGGSRSQKHKKEVRAEEPGMKKKKRFRNVILILFCLALVGVATLLIISGHVTSIGKDRIVTVEQAAELDDVDCIIVFGCQVKEDGSLSHMLRDRLMRGLEVYEAGAAPKLLMSGDHGREDYDEVGAMKRYAIDNGVPSEDIFMDHAGFSTYETVYRAKEIFQADKVILVTQEYHLYRALYIAEQLGVEAYGVSSDFNRYSGQFMRDLREVLARCKDFAMCIFKPEPTYLGEAIPVSGNGDRTNE